MGDKPLRSLTQSNLFSRKIRVCQPIRLLKEIFEIRIQSMLLKNEFNPDAEAEVRDKRRNSSHGIKSAFDEDMEVSFKTQLSLEVVEENSRL